MLDLANRLIAEEFAGKSTETKGRAAFRVCEKLRQPLSTLTGIVGFRSLLSRAHTLAKKDVPWLSKLSINVSGSFEYSTEIETQFDGDDAAKGGAVLISKLLELLITFIGETLTLRLIHDIWPQAALKDKKFGEENL